MGMKQEHVASGPTAAVRRFLGALNLQV